MLRKFAVTLAAASFALIAGTLAAAAGPVGERSETREMRQPAVAAHSEPTSRTRAEPGLEKPVTAERSSLDSQSAARGRS